jgi:FkbM family methyltransferase
MSVNHTGPYHSQFREDRLLEQIFRGKKTGQCVEVGAHDGITGSNTFLFEKKGWKCVLVEPVPELCERIRQFRTGAVFNCAASSSTGEAAFYIADAIESWSALHLTASRKEHFTAGKTALREIKVMKRKLDDILDEAGVSEVDFISIDVEGHELEVLKGFSTERFRPRILIIEDNGESEHSEVPEYMEGKGYMKFFRTGVNDWYGMRFDPVVTPECAARLKTCLSRYEFEDRIKQRYAFLNAYIPPFMKNFLSMALRWISTIIR